MQAKLQSKITLFLIKPIYELSETMDFSGPKWALKKEKLPRANMPLPLGLSPPFLWILETPLLWTIELFNVNIPFIQSEKAECQAAILYGVRFVS